MIRNDDYSTRLHKLLPKQVNIVEVGARDGLQNEKWCLSTSKSP
ncbi:hydroxymethylglutaryl-CoA lyase [Vibrio variabilis]|uniref:Hydroxymethylglutaryl-CoA lyase n=1 Tax=Vibrio variabilis TaxID=990271 RepID=A0ABQ0JEF0_9VIBR|nr:hydroxymethylglutaryl-CoA lyase [Vibrio variabilis]